MTKNKNKGDRGSDTVCGDGGVLGNLRDVLQDRKMLLDMYD